MLIGHGIIKKKMMEISEDSGRKAAVITSHLLHRFSLKPTLFYSDANCPAGQGIKLNGKDCVTCPSGYYRGASETKVTCQMCEYRYTNGVTGGTDESACTSMYDNS